MDDINHNSEAEKVGVGTNGGARNVGRFLALCAKNLRRKAVFEMQGSPTKKRELAQT